MNKNIRFSSIIAISVLSLSTVLAGCSGMTTREKSTATGAVIGGVAGNVVGGGLLGTAAGAAVGGVIGNQVAK